MPTRIIREGILTSERVNKLSERAELFYRRLMSIADDYGRYFAGLENLRVNCYPLRPGSVSNAEIGTFLKELLDADLVRIYGSGKYLQMLDFKQQTRSKSKFPEPTANELLINCFANASHLLSTVGDEGVVECEGVDVRDNKRVREEKRELSGIEIYNAALQRIRTLFGRPEKSNLNFHESSALAEICRRPAMQAELSELEAFKAKDPEFFPKSLESLLRKWDATLDRARTFTPPTKRGQVKPDHSKGF